MAKRLALYLRSSKDRHDVSVDSQRNELTNQAQLNGDLIVTEFIDKVESAKTDNRPSFQAMIAEAKSNTCTFDTIFCYDTSRFSRRQYHAQMYKHLLRSQNIEVTYLKLPKTETILDPIIESLMEAFDEFHSQKSKVDGLRGMKENINQGWRAGGRAILGYKLDQHVVGSRDGTPITKSKLVIDPTTFTRVQSYLKRRALGESRKSVSKDLALDKAYSTLCYIEESALTYAGHTVWNRHNEMIDGHYVGGKKYRDRSEWIIKQNTHEAMISDVEAETILAQRNIQRRDPRRNRVSSYILSGLVKCKCGANLEGNSGYYRCRERCGSRSIKQATIELAVLEALFNEILVPDYFEQLQTEVLKQSKTLTNSQNYQLISLEKQLKDVDRQINKFIELISETKHKRALLNKLDNLEEERILLKEQLEIEKLNSHAPIINTDINVLKKFISEYRQNLEIGEPETKKAILKSVIESATFDGEVLEIKKPGYQMITGVKMASPRGVEPLLPP